MRPRLVLPVLAAAGVTVLATLMSYGFTTEYGAFEGGPLAYAWMGLSLLWPAALVVGVLAGVVPYRLGEGQAAVSSGAGMVLVAIVAIAAGSAWGTHQRAARYPTSALCVADEDASAEEVESIEELEDTLAGLDHPVRFEAASSEATPDRCWIAFHGADDPHQGVAHYRTELVEHGWQVTTIDASLHELLVATRGSLRIRVLDNHGDHGLAGLVIERR